MAKLKPVKADEGNTWGVCETGTGAIAYDGDTFDTREQALFVANFHNTHPNSEWEHDVMPVFEKMFPNELAKGIKPPRRVEQVMIIRHEEVVISTKALQTINEGLAELLELINPNVSYFDSNYEQDFASLKAWIKAHLPEDGEAS